MNLPGTSAPEIAIAAEKWNQHTGLRQRLSFTMESGRKIMPGLFHGACFSGKIRNLANGNILETKPCP